jgi:hypothetical protein
MHSIHSWLRAFFAMQHTAAEARGTIEINAGTDAAARWPRTIGADVISIAAIVDPSLRQLADDEALAIIARWRAVVADIQHEALRCPRASFSGNREFWRTLSSVCVYLHSENAPLPPAPFWTALLSQLGERLGARNAGPSGAMPFKQFDGVKTFDDLFAAQRDYLRGLRGSDDKDAEPGMQGGKKPIPRSTNADVIVLADYWTKQLARVRKVFGAETIEQRWKAATTDIDAIARKADPSAVYPKNNAFWRVLGQTATHVAVADEAPSQTDMMLDALKSSLGDLPHNLKAGVEAIASGASDIAGTIAHGVGHVAHEAGAGLFGGLGVPLLIGGGALVGLYLLMRSGHHESEG